MRNIHKIIGIIAMSAIIAFGVTACGGGGDGDGDGGKTQIAKPTLTVNSFEHDGSPQTVTLSAENAAYTLGGDVTKTAAGDYTATVTLNDTENFEWADGTIAPLQLPWKIVTKPIVDADNLTITIRQTDSVENIQKAIQDALDYSAAHGSDPKVIVKGTKTNGDKILTIVFKSGWTTLEWEAEYAGPGLEIKTAPGKDGSVHVIKNGSIVLNGNLIMETDSYVELYIHSSAVTVNGNVNTSNGDACIVVSKDGLFTVNGNVTALAQPYYPFFISYNGTVTISGNVSVPDGYFIGISHSYNTGANVTIGGVVTVKNANTAFINNKPQTEFAAPSSDKPGYVKYADSDWVVYIKE